MSIEGSRRARIQPQSDSTLVAGGYFYTFPFINSIYRKEWYLPKLTSTVWMLFLLAHKISANMASKRSDIKNLRCREINCTRTEVSKTVKCGSCRQSTLCPNAVSHGCSCSFLVFAIIWSFFVLSERGRLGLLLFFQLIAFNHSFFDIVDHLLLSSLSSLN